MLTVETRPAISPTDAKAMDAATLRAAFPGEGLLAPGEIRLLHTRHDRMIEGGAVPDGVALVLETAKETGTPGFLDRREMGVVNIGDAGTVLAAGQSHPLARGDVLYLPTGSGPATLRGEGRFAPFSSPAHAALPARHLPPETARALTPGSTETANHRTINQFIHPDAMPSCQLAPGHTRFHGGSAWNTTPAHLHDRRIEAHLYFDMPHDRRVIHLMGQPQETRHLVLANEQAVVSPPWSIDCRAGTGSCAFIWSMPGDNVDCRDQDIIPAEALQ